MIKLDYHTGYIKLKKTKRLAGVLTCTSFNQFNGSQSFYIMFTWLASMQVVVHMKPEPAGPVVARTARGIRENIVKSRAFIQMFFSITQFSKVAFTFMKSRTKSKAWESSSMMTWFASETCYYDLLQLMCLGVAYHSD